jgi:anti-sigma factor RsiW
MHRPNPDHANHELTLIAGHAAGDLAVSERIRAESLLQSCTSCADLHRDLIAIAAATHALPTTAVAPRDFRLDAAQAARLRRGSWLRTLLQPFGAARSGVRPMAAALTSLGLAGLFVTMILPGMFGSAASAPAFERDSSGAGLPAATFAPPQPVAAGSSAGTGEGQAVGQPSAPGYDTITGLKSSHEPKDMPEDPAVGLKGSHAPAVNTTTDTSSAVSAPSNPIVLGSVALLAIGLALFVLRFAARRVR